MNLLWCLVACQVLDVYIFRVLDVYIYRDFKLHLCLSYTRSCVLLMIADVGALAELRCREAQLKMNKRGYKKIKKFDAIKTVFKMIHKKSCNANK